MTEDESRPDLDTLADYLEDLLDAEQRADVETLAERDAETAERLRALAGLPALLADEPLEPMPADIAARIDQALAAEPPPVAAPPPATVVAMRPRRRWLAPALVAAAAVGVVGIGAQVVQPGDQGSDSPTAGEAPAQDLSREQPMSEEAAGAETSMSGRRAGAAAPRLQTATFAADVAALVETDVRLQSSPARPALPETVADQEDGCAEPWPRGVLAVRLDGEPALLQVERVPGEPRQRATRVYPADCDVLEQLADLGAGEPGVAPLASAVVTLD